MSASTKITLVALLAVAVLLAVYYGRQSPPETPPVDNAEASPAARAAQAANPVNDDPPEATSTDDPGRITPAPRVESDPPPMPVTPPPAAPSRDVDPDDAADITSPDDLAGNDGDQANLEALGALGEPPPPTGGASGGFLSETIEQLAGDPTILDAPGADSEFVGPPASDADVDENDDAADGGTPPAPARETAPAGPASPDPAPESGAPDTTDDASDPPATVTPPKYETYVVRVGDTFESIAADWFGTPRKSGLIATANPYVDPLRLKVGQELRLPPKDAKRETPTPPGPLAKPINYQIQSGDTLSTIAKAYYGDAKYWRRLYDANRSVIGADPARLIVGKTISIPPPPAEAKEKPSPATPSAGRTHTVASGDSLSTIAVKYYGKADWERIYEANKATIGDDPAALKIGMTLVIPPAPKSD